MVDLDIELIPQLDPRLGRQKVHDPRSLSFAVSTTVQQDNWEDKLIQIYDPRKNPYQCHGECTGCANAMMLNSAGNRDPREVLDMNHAHRVYSQASKIDPWPGSWPPIDAGSSGLAAAKSAQRMGVGGAYRWILGGADQVISTIQEGRVVSVGTWWYDGLFNPNTDKVVEPTGNRAGGHQYVARGYNKERDLVMIRCWWGPYRDVWIRRSHLNDLLMDGGDAHIQDRRIR